MTTIVVGGVETKTQLQTPEPYVTEKLIDGKTVVTGIWPPGNEYRAGQIERLELGTRVYEAFRQPIVLVLNRDRGIVHRGTCETLPDLPWLPYGTKWATTYKIGNFRACAKCKPEEGYEQ